jgi:putative ABC transport system ATP-binding protein
VLVTHNSAIAQVADRVIRIGNGTVQRVEMNPSPLNPRDLSW